MGVDTKMRILIVHNFYGSSAPSGENIAVMSDVQVLRESGDDVFLFKRDSDVVRRLGRFGTILAAAAVPWNVFATRDLNNVCRIFKPDIVHIHNTFPIISPAAVRVARRYAPVVMSLHNYRPFCPAAIPMLRGQPCFQCFNKLFQLPAIMNRCYRGSAFATAPLVTSNFIHNLIGTYKKHVDKFIVLSEFQKDVLISRCGLTPDSLVVKGNYAERSPNFIDYQDRPYQCVFVGRLSSEKGVRTLIKAWRYMSKTAPNLVIIGDGPLAESLMDLAKGLPIEFKGALTHELVLNYVARSQLLINPTECIETSSLVVMEAYSVGTPVITSDLGPVPEIAGPAGRKFLVGDHRQLARLVNELWTDPALRLSLSQMAIREYEERFTPRMSNEALKAAYLMANESWPNV